jgi:hypothetical protein
MMSKINQIDAKIYNLFMKNKNKSYIIIEYLEKMIEKQLEDKIIFTTIETKAKEAK